MMAFPLAPVAFAEGKPGNVFFYVRSRTGPGRRVQRPFPARFFCWVRPAWAREPRPRNWSSSGTFPRSPPATCCVPMWRREPRTGPDGQGDHGARRAGARFPGQRDGRGAASQPDTAKGLHPGRLSADPGSGKLAGWPAGAEGNGLPVIAVSIQVDYNQLLRRITGRRNCPVCQTIYNVYMNPPKREGFCDVEGAALVQRADDTERSSESACALMRP
jgi:hypothetical protein